jgi:hypothetical protein
MGHDIFSLISFRSIGFIPECWNLEKLPSVMMSGPEFGIALFFHGSCDVSYGSIVVAGDLCKTCFNCGAWLEALICPFMPDLRVRNTNLQICNT